MCSNRIVLVPMLLGCAIACGGHERDGYVIASSTGTGSVTATTSPTVTTGTGTSGLQASGTIQGIAIGGTGGGVGASTGESGTTGGACATQSTGAELLPVYLVFGFDRSGSMGKHDEPWHDPTLKWEPVSLATQAFFGDPASAGLSASLTFFPRADAGDKCSPATYAVPDVAMTLLPSAQFAGVLNQVPLEIWVGGTPTQAIMQALIEYSHNQSLVSPGRYVIVLVTDGYPQGCSDVTIDQVATLAASAVPRMPTYVIGIANPPIAGAPETVADLHQIAMSGGTEQAFLIDTGNAAATSTAFLAAIEQIRNSSVSCDLRIPPPPNGSMFDKEKVGVTYTSGITGLVDTLVYDPSCALPNAWHYDDPANPSLIQLCSAMCESIQTDENAVLNVEFACERLIEIPK